MKFFVSKILGVTPKTLYQIFHAPTEIHPTEKFTATSATDPDDISQIALNFGAIFEF